MANLRQSLLLTFLSTNGVTLVQFGVTIVLARLLTPQEIGIYSITAVLVTIAHFFRDFGVASYLQQTKDLSKEKVSSAFGVLLTSSWLIALITYLASPLAGDYFQQAGVTEVMQVLALGFMFIPFGAVTHSLLTRDYRAKEQAYVRMWGAASYAISAIWLAYTGHSYMSMPWANLVNIIVTALAYLPYRPEHVTWRPSFRGWRNVVQFGAGATLGNAINAVNNAIPDLVLGKLSGPHDVGVMSRSISTTQMLNQVLGPTITYAVLPYFSRTHHEGQNLSGVLIRACSYLTGLMWPAMVCTALFAEPLTLFLYGEAWRECIPVIQIICGMYLLGVPYAFLGTAFMALGKPYLATIPSVAAIVTRAACLWLLYSGSIESFAWSLVAASLVMYPAFLIIQRLVFKMPWGAFLGAQLHSLWPTLMCAGVAKACIYLLSEQAHLIQILVGGLLVPLTWVLTLWWTRHPLRAELERAMQRFPKLSHHLRILMPR